MEPRKEGFWFSTMEPTLPMPVPEERKWSGQGAFVSQLQRVQHRAEETRYRGWSMCRCCNIANGNAEYELGGWVWPQGYEHYIVAHNVRPSPLFHEFIMSQD